jgi:HSP20 family protein
MTTRSNPFEELERMFERLNRQFEEVSESWGTGEAVDPWTGRFESMAIDLVERDDAYVAHVDLPGFDRDEIELRVTDHTLHVEADHEETEATEGEQFIRRERAERAQERSVRLPDEVDTDAVEASMNNGVLTVTLPKTEEETATKIDIE